MTDHVAEAESMLAAEYDQEHFVAAAQVHATLALVEQQRIANERMGELIAHVLAK